MAGFFMNMEPSIKNPLLKFEKLEEVVEGLIKDKEECKKVLAELYELRAKEKKII